MERIERAMLAVAIEVQFRSTLQEVVARKTANRDEQLEIASGVIALMLRKMYQQRGEDWLTAVLKQVLQPDP